MDSNIEILCKEKEQELLTRYYGRLVEEAAIERPETIGNYTKDLPLKIEAEYRAYLEDLWHTYVATDVPLVLEEQGLRMAMTEDDREGVDRAFDKAEERTLWERITRSNHEDVTYYKGLLRQYTKELLLVMRLDFLEEITGRHIG